MLSVIMLNGVVPTVIISNAFMLSGIIVNYEWVH
jgi:hypothetical protein